jgi:arginase
MRRASGVLLEAGLADGLGARRAGCLPARGYSGARDPQTLVMNPQPLHDYSRSLADAVEAILDGGEFPVVLGGDCSLLPNRPCDPPGLRGRGCGLVCHC